MKNQLNEMLSLIDRMDNLRTGWAVLTENLNENSSKWKYVETRPEAFYNTLTSVPDGQFITFGYVNAVKVDYPKMKERYELTDKNGKTRMSTRTVNDFATFGQNIGEEGKITGVIKLTVYNMQWQTEGKVSKQYADWANLRNQLGQTYGVEFGKAKYGTEKMNYGNKGGISSYDGDNKELSDHTYTNLNTKNLKPLERKYYLVFEDGTLKEIEKERLPLLPHKTIETAIDKLLAAGATQEEVEPLTHMNYQRYLHSQILFFAATVDGIPQVFINTLLPEKIGGVTNADPQQLFNIAKERYAKYMNNGV